jgi:hypothetical protein
MGDEVSHGFLDRHERGVIAERQHQVAEYRPIAGWAVPGGVASMAHNRRDAAFVVRTTTKITRVQAV